MPVYAFIDVSRKQEFIYRHNKLKDNLYNSFIIKTVTENIEDDTLDKEALEALADLKVRLTKYLQENHQGDYSFLYSGGGNSIVQFSSQETARNFIRGYSKAVLEEYPELELYISLTTATQNFNYKEIRKDLHKKADELKDKRKSRFKRLSYGVEEIDETGRALLAVERKKNYKGAKDFLYRLVRADFQEEEQAKKIEFIDELDLYKKGDGDKSYIGVIAIDGNQMGEMVSKVEDFTQLREFSNNIEAIYRESVAKGIKKIVENKEKEMAEQGKSYPLYVSPILMAGDDICLITEARYAIEMAAEIIKNIISISKVKPPEIKDVWQENGYLSACGGVAIAKAGYPFFEMVRAAEALCHGAKENIYKTKADKKNQKRSFLNWDILQGPVAKTSKYTSKIKHGNYQENYHIKPLCLDQDNPVEDGVYNYTLFKRLLDGINIKLEKAETTGEEISNSSLEELRKTFYLGWEQYQLHWQMKRSQETLDQFVQNEVKPLPEGFKCKYGVLENEKGKQFTYILHDVLEVLPFMRSFKGVGKNGQ